MPALPPAGACWAWLLEDPCCVWPVAGACVLLCAWVGWAVPVGDTGAVVWACAAPLELPGSAVVEAGAVWAVVLCNARS